MSAPVEYAENRATEDQLAEHLERCDADFVPPLSGRTDLRAYARKIRARAERFEAWADGVLVGLVAAYVDDAAGRTAFVTNVSVVRERARQGIAVRLMERCLDRARAAGMRRVRLDVNEGNVPAIRLYERLGFAVEAKSESSLTFRIDLGERP